MSALVSTCSSCRVVARLEATRMHLRVHETVGQVTGGCLFECPACGQVDDRPLDAFGVAMLVLGGVTPEWPDPARSGHPERPPAGARLTTDDLLELHALLQSETWFGRLLALR